MLPFLLLPLAGAAALGGIGMAIDASEKREQAKKRIRAARDRYEQATDRFEARSRTVESDLEELGRARVRHVQDTLTPARELLDAIGQRTRIAPIPGLDRVRVRTGKAVAKLEADYAPLADLLAGAGVGAAAGVAAAPLVAGGLLGAVGALGTASTGTAIAALSGAAAESATLAALGGGALAAGGGGIALGTVVLGGVALAPIALLAGFGAQVSAEEALTRAAEVEAEVDRGVGEIDTRIAAMEAVRARAGELGEVAEQLAARVRTHTRALRVKVLQARNPDAALRRHLDRFRLFMALLDGLVKVLRVPVIADVNTLTLHPDGTAALEAARKVMSDRR